MELTAEKPASQKTPAAIRVMVVDDNEAFCLLVKQMLEPQGYTVSTVADPVKALELYNRDKSAIDLVIVDYFMPTMDGAKTFEWLRKLNPNIKVILCSGAEELKLKQVCAQYHIEAYIHKPFRIHDAQHVIRRVLTGKSR